MTYGLKSFVLRWFL